MKDKDKTKEQLLYELAKLHRRNTELEKAEIRHKHMEADFYLQSEIVMNMAEGVQLTRTSDGVIVYANPKFEKMFGYERGKLVGKHVSILNAPSDKTPQEKAKEIIKSLEETDVWFGEIENIKKNGTHFWCRAGVSTLKHPHHGEIWVAIHEDITEKKRVEEELREYREHLEELIEKRTDELKVANERLQQDITERKKAEEKIKAALKEKEVMLKEIHHRVKNNMQIISSLLKLQFVRTKSKKLQEMLRTSQSRLHSMALIHERLYQSKDFTRIDFAYYIRSLTVYLFHSYRVDSNLVRLKTDVRDVHLDINRAIPCGLIVNELVSNSLKHAFPGGREGEIFIKFYFNKQGKIILVVRDNGIGFPEDIDFRSTESFGMQVVNDLTEQLRGTIELDRKGGTTFKVVF